MALTMDAMRRLLAVSDFYPARGDAIPEGGAVLPPLPALSELLRIGAAQHTHEDWRTGLASDLDAPVLGGLAPATVAAFAVDGIGAGSGVCMATPVHMVAGMASVHLHPAGLLSLRPDEAAALQLGFQREFGDSSQRLHIAGRGFVLESPLAAAANAVDPARLLGNPLEGFRTPDAARQELRRLGVEVEMWLTGLQLNRERERRGELPVSALWFWGGGAAQSGDAAGDNAHQRRHATRWEQAYGDDPWLSGCWRRLTGQGVAAAQGWDRIDSHSALAVTSATRGLQQLEAGWFEPALRDLRARRVSSLTLRIGGRSWELGSRMPRWWRRTRPWWEVLAA